jgi:hypothetical protein
MTTPRGPPERLGILHYPPPHLTVCPYRTRYTHYVEAPKAPKAPKDPKAPKAPKVVSSSSGPSFPSLPALPKAIPAVAAPRKQEVLPQAEREDRMVQKKESKVGGLYDCYVQVTHSFESAWSQPLNP